MPTPPQVHELVKRFDDNLADYKRGLYNETQVRREFIDPLFKVLGWDIDNEKGYAEAYKEVVHEDAIRVGRATKAPDYSFRIGGVRKFFLEAKKPSVNIKEDVHPAFQLRRYAWSAKLPLSILTDFEEFAVYDCRVKPVKTDQPAAARILYFTYADYPARWPELVDIFSPEAIRKGAFDRYVEAKKTKKGTAAVDDAFLQEIERWRELLAKNLALRNSLSPRQLNFSVQTIIDRIIFLRIAEDRGLEPYGQLMALQNGPHAYERLGQLCRRADQRYNSGLFYFAEEKGRADHPDELTPGLRLDDRVLQDIFKHLYYPDSPYEFSVLPADILGQVYEQFLGQVIRLTAGGHRAVVEDKPEVKKAGGVFYTPTYIVDYIVRQTVGQWLAGKTPDRLRGQKPLRILDPACGSGSFLLGAYQYLLDWQRDWYLANDPLKWARGRSPRLYQTQSGEWKLTTAERKQILLSHIYGVDIDPQAVEVTKLSLLLKVLEGEDEQSLGRQLMLFQERALPDLGRNIKCGNSLIGPDFYQQNPTQLSMFGDEELYRINAFDWPAEFAAAMQDGGFDAVIGNPPYIRIQAMKEWAPREVEFYKERYVSASKGNYDIYVVFVEKGLDLLNERGRLGFILPNKFLATDYGLALRKIISERHALVQLIDFEHSQVFEQATTYTCLLFLSGKDSPTFEYLTIESPTEILTTNLQFKTQSTSSLSEKPWLLMTDSETSLYSKLGQNTTPLLELPTAISRGSSSGDDKIFMLTPTSTPNSYVTDDGQIVEIEDEILRITLFATDFNRYSFNPRKEKVIIFPYRISGRDFELISEVEFKTNFPKAFRYLQANKKKLEQRKQYQIWYSFSAPRNLALHDLAHIVVPLLAEKGSYTELPKDHMNYCLMASGGFSITLEDNSPISPKYILGLLNSSLLFWYLKSISNRFRGGWITCTKQYVGKLPIRTIDFTDPADRARHDQLAALVERMLDLQRQAAAAGVPQTKTMLHRQIAALDGQIDRRVYELYGLSEEEIKIVEDRE
ncbi:MAG: N-6 DNA methylase [Chloroflexota bacterium]